MTYLGIDIGGSCVKAAVLDDGKIVSTRRSEFYQRPDANRLRAAIAEAVGKIGRVDGVGLCVPGILNRQTRRVMMAVNVPGLVGLDLDTLGESATRPVILNDALAAALDLHQVKKIPGRLMVLAIGTGVGAAVLDDGVPLNHPGHWGFVDVSIAGHEAIAADGSDGSLEAYIGAAALRGVDLENLAGDEPPMLALVRAIRIAHAIHRPNCIALCGGIGVRLRHLLPILHARISDRLTTLASSGWQLACGDDEFHAARGAAWAAGNPVTVLSP